MTYAEVIDKTCGQSFRQKTGTELRIRQPHNIMDGDSGWTLQISWQEIEGAVENIIGPAVEGPRQKKLGMKGTGTMVACNLADPAAFIWKKRSFIALGHKNGDLELRIALYQMAKQVVGIPADAAGRMHIMICGMYVSAVKENLHLPGLFVKINVGRAPKWAQRGDYQKIASGQENCWKIAPLRKWSA